MTAKVIETGEIVNLADYAKITLDQHDSWGNPIELKPEEVELLQDITEDEHWQDVRERAAIAAMCVLIGKSVTKDTKWAVENAIEYADELVEQLKKKEQ